MEPGLNGFQPGIMDIEPFLLPFPAPRVLPGQKKINPHLPQRLISIKWAGFQIRRLRGEGGR